MVINIKLCISLCLAWRININDVLSFEIHIIVYSKSWEIYIKCIILFSVSLQQWGNNISPSLIATTTIIISSSSTSLYARTKRKQKSRVTEDSRQMNKGRINKITSHSSLCAHLLAQQHLYLLCTRLTSCLHTRPIASSSRLSSSHTLPFFLRPPSTAPSSHQSAFSMPCLQWNEGTWYF